MKCKKCGKRFSYQDYSGICPKCGTYNRQVEVQNVQQDQPGPDIQFVRESTGSVVEKWEKYFRILFFGTIVVVVLTILLTVAKHLAKSCMYGGSYWKSKVPTITEMPVEEAGMNEALLLEETYGRTLTVKYMETVAEADTINGFPKGEKLLAVHLSSNELDNITYDTFQNPMVDEFYLQWDKEKYRGTVEEYELENDYPSVYGDHDGISGYDFVYPQAREGDVFFFVPADASNLQLLISVCSADDGKLIKYYRVPVAEE